jgi:hypothetical protein
MSCINLSEKVTKMAKIAALPTQRTMAEAFGVNVRTIRDWKRRAAMGEQWFPFDKTGYWPFVPYHPERWLLVAKAKKLHEQLIKDRFRELVEASVILHGICPGHVTDPAKQRLLEINVGKFIHPEAAKAIRPENALHLAVAKLQLAGKDVTRQTLAETFGCSVRTLQRRYDPRKLREVCPIKRRRKPKIDSAKTNDLAA